MQNDLFGHMPSKSDPPAVSLPADPPVQHTAETIRVLMHEILAEARSADVMPWTPRKLRSNTAMFPYMAEWLKNGEGDCLMQQLKTEMDRLQAPADQVASNWRRIWGTKVQVP